MRGLDRQVTAFGAAQMDPAVVAVVLTPREVAVLGLVARGLTAAAAGRRLDITERTVNKHLERAYRKLGANDRVTAVLRAQQAGLLRAATAPGFSGLTSR